MSKIYQVKVDGNTYEVEVEFLSETSSQNISSIQTPINTTPVQSTPASTTSKGESINAPMQGNVWKILTKVGDAVQAGQTILVLEAMKMENNIVAPRAGTIVALPVKEGDNVSSGAVLAELA